MTSNEGSTSQYGQLTDIMIVWLDEAITNLENQALSSPQTVLLPYIKSIQRFTDCLECREYIENIHDTNVFFVISGSLCEKLVADMHDLSQLTAIYIFCTDAHKHETWTRQFKKIRGVFVDDGNLSVKIKDDVCSLSSSNFPFGFFDSSQQTLKCLSKEQASFIWFQLLLEVLLRLPQTQEAKHEMIAECRSNYKENEAQLEKIMVFEQTYKPSDAIKWYTENTFVFQLFNKAFRTQDFDVIFKYRFFLVDLFNQLSSLHKQQYKNVKGSLTVHRGQMMFRDELVKLKQNVGHLISINTFFSTSRTCAVAADFSGDGEHESMGIVSVIFSITIDLTVPCRPFANIDQLSCIKDESEILFSIGTIFRIESVDLVTNTLWFVQLTWNQDDREQLNKMKQLTDLLSFYTGHHIGNSPSILTFGLFLSKMGLLQQAKHFYLYLFKILPSDHPDRAALHNNIGEVLRRLNYFNHARYHFVEALECCADTISIFHPFWAIVHSNIALVDLHCKRPKQALKFYRCALLIIRRLQDLNEEQTNYVQEMLATVYHGMGSAYLDLDQSQTAFAFYHKTLEIELEILPHNHPTLFDTYDALSKVNTILNNWKDALENCKESLKIAQQNLLPNDSRLINLHLNAAILTYNVDRNVSKTLVHCSQALKLMEHTTSSRFEQNQLEVYKTLANLYTHMGLRNLGLPLWEKFIQEGKFRFIVDSNAVDIAKLREQVNKRKIPELNLDHDSKYMILADDKYTLSVDLPRLESIARCDMADSWRARGLIKPAINYYTWLLKYMPTTDDLLFNRYHKSRLHNNIAACYQDLDDNHMALHHYRLSLDNLSSEEENKSMLKGIIHYNIASLCMNINELDEAQAHLQKSLIHFPKTPETKDRILRVGIYTAFAYICEQHNDWNMARDYYQQVLHECKNNIPGHSAFDKYEKRLQFVINKINENA